MPTSRSAWDIALTASLSAAWGARLKLIVTAGNCSSWATTKGAVVCSNRANVLSGTIGLPETPGMMVGAFAVSDVDWATAAIPDEGTSIFGDAVGSLRYSGWASRITRY